MNAFNTSFHKLTLSTNLRNCYQSVRFLPRWQHRRPVETIKAEDYDEAKGVPKKKHVQNKKTILDVPSQINWRHPNLQKSQENEGISYKLKSSVRTSKEPLTISKQKTVAKGTDMLELTIDGDGNFIYTKMKNNDSRISSILVQMKSKCKKETDRILLEGKRLIKEALQANCKMEYILFSRMKELEYLRPFLPKLGAKLYKLPYREMQLWSDLTTNPGIMGVFKIPDTEAYPVSPHTLPIVVICDNIREAGNLGALLRTCSGVGCEMVILTKGCVNVWDSKVLRAACGAHFNLKIKNREDWESIKSHIDSNTKLYIADNNTLSTDSDVIHSVPVVPYYGVNFNELERIIIIAGGETEGISQDAYKLAEEFNGVRLNIPLNNIESLNTGTALGIIAFEIKRQLLKSKATQQSI